MYNLCDGQVNKSREKTQENMKVDEP